MAEFWEQQLMDRLLNLCFEYRKAEKESLPKERLQDVIDYVKFLLHNTNSESGSEAIQTDQ